MAYANPYDERAKAARRRWYAKNKDRQLSNQAKRRKERKAWLRSLKVSCQRCGWDEHPCGLQFHHRNPSDKGFDIQIAAQNGISKDRILEEIAKCDILCANCHAVEHFGK